MGEAVRAERLAEQEYSIRRNVFRYCESELYDYHASKARLKDLQEDVLHGMSSADCGLISHDPSDVVQARVLRLVSDREITRLTRITQAIEQVYASLPEEYRELIRWKYWQGRPIDWMPDVRADGLRRLTRDGLATQLHIGTTTFDRRRREIIALLAYRLGV